VNKELTEDSEAESYGKPISHREPSGKDTHLAFIEDVGGRPITHHGLRVILVESALRVPNVGDVFHND
jgi:hypothetical protein